MRTPYVEPIERYEFEEQMTRMLETLRLLNEYGGTMDRWQSLVAISKSAEIIFKLIRLINGAPQATPALRFLSLRWNDHTSGSRDEELDAVEDVRHEGHLEECYSLSHDPKRPQLCHVELHGVPSGFIFDRSSPIVSNLTTLTLVAGKFLPAVEGISALLRANSRLESLRLAVGDAFDFGTVPTFTAPSTSLQVRLPFLRSFSLDATTVHYWGLEMLQIIDAPDVEYFELNIGTIYVSDPALAPLCQYLCAGRSSGVLRCITAPDTESPTCGSVFPALRHLNIPCKGTEHSTDSLIFKAFPTVTHLTLGLPFLEILDKGSDFFPSLAHITYKDPVSDDFVRAIFSIVKRREELGWSRIEVLEIPELDINNLTGVLRVQRENGRDDIVEQLMIILRQLVNKLSMYQSETESIPDSDDLVPFDSDEIEEETVDD